MLIHINGTKANVLNGCAQLVISIDRGGSIAVDAYVNGECTSSSFHCNARSPIEESAIAQVRSAIHRVLAFDPEAFPAPAPANPAMNTVFLRRGL